MNIQPAFAGYKINIIPASTPTTLEENIANQLKIKPTPTVVKKFANGETYVNIEKDVRNQDVYIMPVASHAVNDNLMETYLKADAARRMGAHRVIAVLPNFPYGRQERKTESGEPISARLNMSLLHASGVDEIITTDLHAPALQGFVREITMTELNSADTMVKYFKKKKLDKTKLVVVSPDLGGIKRADKFAKQLDCDKAVVVKNRFAHNQSKAEMLLGDVKGKDCIIYDDMIDTAGTITEAAKMLHDHGAKDIYICAAHGIFSGDAISKLQKAPVKEIVVTNSENKPTYDKIKQVDIAPAIVGKMLDISG